MHHNDKKKTMKNLILLILCSIITLTYLIQHKRIIKSKIKPHELNLVTEDSLLTFFWKPKLRDLITQQSNTSQHIKKHELTPIKPIYPGRYKEKNKNNKSKVGYYTESEWKGLDRNKKKIIIDNFLTYIIQGAKEESKVYPQIPYQLYVAQAILESNYGCSYIANSANNIYGHKYWGKDTTKHVTAKDDGPLDKFKKYPSIWFSIRAHSKLLMGIYWERLEGEPTLETWLETLCGGKTLEESIEFVKNKKGGVYATACYDREDGEVYYSDKIRRIIKCYDL